MPQSILLKRRCAGRRGTMIIQPTPLSGLIYSIRLNVFLVLSIRWIRCTPEGTGLSCQPKWCRQRATPKNPQISRSWDCKGGPRCSRTESHREEGSKTPTRLPTSSSRGSKTSVSPKLHESRAVNLQRDALSDSFLPLSW